MVSKVRWLFANSHPYTTPRCTLCRIAKIVRAVTWQSWVIRAYMIHLFSDTLWVVIAAPDTNGFTYWRTFLINCKVSWVALRYVSKSSQLGLLPAGSTYYIIVTVFGARDLVSGSSTGLVRNVTFISIMSLSGDVLMKLPAFSVQPMRQYAAAVVLPPDTSNISILLCPAS